MITPKAQKMRMLGLIEGDKGLARSGVTLDLPREPKHRNERPALGERKARSGIKL